jgi:hypothetical protein
VKPAWFYCGSALLVWCCFAQPARAQTQPSPCSVETKSRTGASPVIVERNGSYVSVPADVDLRLTLDDGKSVYREGEIIRLTLAFTSTAKEKYASSTRTYDHSGRLDLETFCVTPDSGRDPLQDYYRSGIFGYFVGGGLSSMDHPLSRIPYVVNEELNEWRSLRPGSYTLRVASDRVAQTRSTGTTGPGSGPVLVLSNAVTFQVVAATPQWQSEQFTLALSVLDAKRDNLTQVQSDQIQHAERVLRFLDSAESTRELARRFWFYDRPPGPLHTAGEGYPAAEFYQSLLERNSWNFKAGLIGSPFREVAIEELNAMIDDHQHPATRGMVETLALLEIQSQTENRFLPYDSSRKEEWEKRVRPRLRLTTSWLTPSGSGSLRRARLVTGVVKRSHPNLPHRL